jgi:hypothetical protein
MPGFRFRPSDEGGSVQLKSCQSLEIASWFREARREEASLLRRLSCGLRAMSRRRLGLGFVDGR